jgi:hypothetical protein
MDDKSQYLEIWIDSPDGQSMCALINGEQGMLLYLRLEGDAGFSSRNPKYTGPDDATLEYYLSNGQRDEYPLVCALPLDEVNRALEYFESNHKPPAFISWHNESGDGVKL